MSPEAEDQFVELYAVCDVVHKDVEAIQDIARCLDGELAKRVIVRNVFGGIEGLVNQIRLLAEKLIEENNIELPESIGAALSSQYGGRTFKDRIKNAFSAMA